MTGSSPRVGVAREGSFGSGMLMRNPRVSGREAAFQGAEGAIRYPPLPSCAQSKDRHRSGVVDHAHQGKDAAPAPGEMHRRRLKSLLAEYRERWPQESATVARFDAFVDSHSDCFHRSCRVGHVTGSAWVVDMAGDRVLLAHHRKLGRWLQPGGHSDGDLDTRAVALREAREESGLLARALNDAIFDIDVHGIPARGREPAHLHFDVRFLVQARHDRFKLSEESHALAWVPAVGLDALTHEESVLRMARKWLVRRGNGDG